MLKNLSFVKLVWVLRLSLSLFSHISAFPKLRVSFAFLRPKFPAHVLVLRPYVPCPFPRNLLHLLDTAPTKFVADEPGRFLTCSAEILHQYPGFYSNALCIYQASCDPHRLVPKVYTFQPPSHHWVWRYNEQRFWSRKKHPLRGQ